jgi:putative transposase
MDRLLLQRGMPPGKPTGNAFVESFNGRFRDEFLNTYRFWNLDDTKGKIGASLRVFAETQSRTTPGFMTPADKVPEFSFWLDENPKQGQATLETEHNDRCRDRRPMGVGTYSHWHNINHRS